MANTGSIFTSFSSLPRRGRPEAESSRLWGVAESGRAAISLSDVTPSEYTIAMEKVLIVANEAVGTPAMPHAGAEQNGGWFR